MGDTRAWRRGDGDDLRDERRASRRRELAPRGGGYDVLDEMAAVATDDNDKPLERIEILKAEVVSDKEALSHMYIAGPKPLSKKTDPLASQSSRR